MHPTRVWREGGIQASEKEAKLLNKRKGEEFNSPRTGGGRKEWRKQGDGRERGEGVHWWSWEVTHSTVCEPLISNKGTKLTKQFVWRFFVCWFVWFSYTHHQWVEFLSGLYSVISSHIRRCRNWGAART